MENKYFLFHYFNLILHRAGTGQQAIFYYKGNIRTQYHYFATFQWNIIILPWDIQASTFSSASARHFLKGAAPCHHQGAPLCPFTFIDPKRNEILSVFQAFPCTMQFALFWAKLLPALFLKKPWHPCSFEILAEALFSTHLIGPGLWTDVLILCNASWPLMLPHQICKTDYEGRVLSRHEGISAFSNWTECGLLSLQSLAKFAEIRFRTAIVPGWVLT
jgi:hypothetical protein